MLSTAPSTSCTDGETDNSTCNTYTGQDIQTHEAASILFIATGNEIPLFSGVKTDY